jgi:hypothetical protein
MRKLSLNTCSTYLPRTTSYLYGNGTVWHNSIDRYNWCSQTKLELLKQCTKLKSWKSPVCKESKYMESLFHNLQRGTGPRTAWTDKSRRSWNSWKKGKQREVCPQHEICYASRGDDNKYYERIGQNRGRWNLGMKYPLRYRPHGFGAGSKRTVLTSDSNPRNIVLMK